MNDDPVDGGITNLIDTDPKATFISYWNTLHESADRQEQPVRLFKRKAAPSLLSVYGADSHWIAAQLGTDRHRVAVLTSARDPSLSLDMVHVERSRLPRLLQVILVDGGRSACLYVKGAHSDRWELRRTAIPSSLRSIDGFLDSNTDEDASVTMAISVLSKQNQHTLGICTFDADNYEMSCVEIVEADQLDIIESILIQYSPSRCLVQQGTAPVSQRIVKLIESLSIPVEQLPRSLFAPSHIEQDLTRFLIDSNVQSIKDELVNVQAMSALAALIRHLSLMSNEMYHGSCRLSRLNLDQFMKLDHIASRSLHLFPSIHDATKDSSLYGLLNQCKTVAGSRLLRQWIRQPLKSIDDINRRLNIVDLFTQEVHITNSLRDTFLRRVPDLASLSKRLVMNKATLKDCVRLYQFALTCPSGVAMLAEYPEHVAQLDVLFLSRLQSISEDLRPFESLIEKTIDLDAAQRHEYMIKAEFSPELMTLRDENLEIEADIDIIRVKVEKDLGFGASKLKLNHSDSLGYHFRITRKEEKKLRTSSLPLITLETRKDGVKFTHRSIQSLNSRCNENSRSYRTLQRDIVAKCLSIVASYVPVIDECCRLLAQLDVLSTFAHVSISFDYCRPQMNTQGILNVFQSRHPMLEQQSLCSSFIPNDCKMESDSKLHIISGPNMGGKSTYLRQIGLLVIMSQIGSHIPCSSLCARIPIVDCILARVGAGDSQLRGVSTFYSEMLESANILRYATANSLLIIDELGRGTSTADGFGLAWSIAKYIADKISCLCLFATHFHELTALDQLCANVINRHVSANIDRGDNITMLYEVRPGPSDHSFGIYVAEIAKFPQQVVTVAKRKAKELDCAHSESSTLAAQFANIPFSDPSIGDEEIMKRCRVLVE